MYEFVLASQSPRRQQILAEAGYQFRIFPIEISEILNKNLSLEDQISDCARRKAQAAADDLKSSEPKDFLILAADTVVVLRDQVLGKPHSKQEASLILSQLSEQVHRVITGFCLLDLRQKRFVLGHETTQIQFKKLSQNDVESYVDSGDPMDKAGAYGIQGEARKFVAAIDGDFKNVVGLPIDRISKLIDENGWNVPRN